MDEMNQKSKPVKKIRRCVECDGTTTEDGGYRIYPDELKKLQEEYEIRFIGAYDGCLWP